MEGVISFETEAGARLCMYRSVSVHVCFHELVGSLLFVIYNSEKGTLTLRRLSPAVSPPARTRLGELSWTEVESHSEMLSRKSSSPSVHVIKCSIILMDITNNSLFKIVVSSFIDFKLNCVINV